MKPVAACAVAFMFMVAAGSATAASLKTSVLQARLDKSTSVVAWWDHRGHWALFIRHRHCWQVTGWKQRRVCRMARASRAAHQARAARIYAVLHPTPPNDWAEFSCIYGNEKGRGGAATNTGNGYYGGLQMDIGFQRTYGSEFLRRWGTADNWPVWAQVAAARRARDGYGGYPARGYGPWPNTARSCGQL